MIGQQLGHQVAATVARDLVVYMRRSGGDPQLSPWVMHRNHVNPVLHRVQDAVIKDPAARWSAARLAAVACMSSRNLARLFAEHAGCSPLDYVQRLRVALARELVANSELANGARGGENRIQLGSSAAPRVAEVGGDAADGASGESVGLKHAGAILRAMSGEGEAAGDVLTGAIVAGTIEGASGKKGPAAHAASASIAAPTLDGAFCSSCGQRAHLHRSLLHLGHDILHGVFHFEGKLWRTIPELFFHPGRLTRRYIDGERAKFISPMALYLFTVFLMFGVFSFTTSNVFDSTKESVAGDVVEQWKENNQSAKERTQERADAVREELEDPDLSPQKRAELEQKLSELQSAQAVMDALAKGDWAALQNLETNETAKQALEEAKQKADAGVNKKSRSSTDINIGWPALQERLERNVKELKDNPSLAFYKLKIASYKYSWALIPLSRAVHVAAVLLAARHPFVRPRDLHHVFDQLHDDVPDRADARCSVRRQRRDLGHGARHRAAAASLQAAAPRI